MIHLVFRLLTPIHHHPQPTSMPAQLNSLPIRLSREERTLPHSPHGTCNSYPSCKETESRFRNVFSFSLIGFSHFSLHPAPSSYQLVLQFFPQIFNGFHPALTHPLLPVEFQSSPSFCIKLKSLAKVVISTSPTYVIRTRRISTPSRSTQTALEKGREETAGMREARMSLNWKLKQKILSDWQILLNCSKMRKITVFWNKVGTIIRTILATLFT